MTKIFYFGDYRIKVPDRTRLYDLCAELKSEFPDLKMGHKRKLWWHWVSHVLICIFTLGMNRSYIDAFTTTAKNRVDWGDGHHQRIQSGKDLDRVWACLMHEREHLRQFAKYGTFLMVLIWAIPPILFCYGRAVVIEKPGYIQSLRAKWEINRPWAEDARYKEWWVSQFVGPNYGWMWVLKSQVEGWFDKELEKLRKEEESGST